MVLAEFRLRRLPPPLLPAAARSRVSRASTVELIGRAVVVEVKVAKAEGEVVLEPLGQPARLRHAWLLHLPPTALRCLVPQEGLSAQLTPRGRQLVA